MKDLFKSDAILLFISLLALSFVYCKNALHMFQQNRYEFKRYTNWLFDLKRFKLDLLVVYFIFILIAFLLRTKINVIVVIIITIIYAIYTIYKEDKVQYIKPLVYTGRVKRQVVFYTLLMIICDYLLARFVNPYLTFVLAVIMPYLIIYLVALLTWPIEEAIKAKYKNEAMKILRTYDDLKIVGVTGSYGKTTTKNVIKDIIEDKYFTLITPASFNTPMGITRTIREYLKPSHEVFICEMGADHVGEITNLMKFVRPQIGIVTSIGPQHLNTFGSLDNIINEKMQEIELLPSDGLGIINIDNQYIKNYKIRNNCKILTVGIENENADYLAYDLKYSKNGSSFKVKLHGRTYKFNTILLGAHNIVNVLCGIALADYFGIEPKDIVKGVENIKQVEHRLQLKDLGGFTFIDNAFNSNPVGCKYALDVLSMMDGKKIIVTPGLIDLGSKENDYNYEFGKYMKDKADFVILVGEKNSAYVYKGALAAGFEKENILVVNNVKEAFNYIYTHFTKKDTILLENDLPDAFLH